MSKQNSNLSIVDFPYDSWYYVNDFKYIKGEIQMDYQDILKGKKFSELSAEQLDELERCIPVRTNVSTFSLSGPGAWPGGGSLGAGAWYYTDKSPNEWQYAHNDVGVWFNNSGEFYHYLRQLESGEIIHIHWEGEEN